jgi:hypothetical protein
MVANTVHLFRLLAGEIDLLFLGKKKKAFGFIWKNIDLLNIGKISVLSRNENFM